MQVANRICRSAVPLTATPNNGSGAKVLINCTTAGTLTLTMRTGPQVVLALTAGTLAIENVDVSAAVWSGGGAGTVYALA